MGAAEALKAYLSWQWEAPHWLIMFLPAIMVSAWLGGFGPGLVSTVTSALVVVYFELPPRLSIRVEDVSELIGVGVLIGIGVLLSFVARRDRG